MAQDQGQVVDGEALKTWHVCQLTEGVGDEVYGATENWPGLEEDLDGQLRI